ncbi:MAG TPA: sigma 54-interacting transcriptional regulator [Burkholderiales bacterium]|nr:sigma 54-interacting transcriptional regulator [Burkholderiales bacterium]
MMLPTECLEKTPPARQPNMDGAEGRRALGPHEHQRRERQQRPDGFGLLFGVSPRMLEVYRMIRKVAPTDATVFVVGESGSGKELVAHTIHQFSSRAGKPFVAVNCGAIPANLIEAELFGYEKGAFTGAVRAHKGFFERAAGGTLFLDEIAEMAPEMQVRLLRVLDAGCFTRVGGDVEIPCDVRVVAATNRPPALAVDDNHLREDLMYRLAVFPIELPPLRERGDDIALLARHFVEELNQKTGASFGLTPAALDKIRAHPWPGNVRELKNCLHRAYILADNNIDVEHLVTLPRQNGAARGAGGDSLRFAIGTSLEDMERETIFATLDHCGGNKRRTAEMLGVSLKTLYNRLTEYAAEARQSAAPAVPAPSTEPAEPAGATALPATPAGSTALPATPAGSTAMPAAPAGSTHTMESDRA